MQHVAELKRSSILGLVLPKDKDNIGETDIITGDAGKRENHTGYGAFQMWNRRMER